MAMTNLSSLELAIIRGVTNFVGGQTHFKLRRNVWAIIRGVTNFVGGQTNFKLRRNVRAITKGRDQFSNLLWLVNIVRD